MDSQQLRQQIVKHLKGGEAFMPIDDLLPKLPFGKLGTIPGDLPSSLWQLFHHLYIAQKDILEFSRDPEYISPDWPEGYWKKNPAPQSENEWTKTIEAYHIDREALSAMVLDDQVDLMEPFAHGNGQTLFREALLVVEHTAYHTGQMLILARLLQII